MAINLFGKLLKQQNMFKVVSYARLLSPAKYNSNWMYCISNKSNLKMAPTFGLQFSVNYRWVEF